MSKTKKPESGPVNDAGAPERELSDDELEAVRGGKGGGSGSTVGPTHDSSFVESGSPAITGNYVTPSGPSGGSSPSSPRG